MTVTLLALSKNPVCDERTKDGLQQNASWLIQTLGDIPEDRETLAFVLKNPMKDKLFEAMSDAKYFGCDEISEQIGSLLLSWAFVCGRYGVGMANLSEVLCGMAAFALKNGQTKELIVSIRKHSSNNPASSQKIREEVARSIRRESATLFETRLRGGFYGMMERCIAEADHEKLSPFLEQIASILDGS